MIAERDEAPSSRPLVEALINPAAVYPSPAAVLGDTALTPLQRRAALVAWARDALSLETAASDALEDLEVPSRIDEVLDALAEVDAEAAWEYRGAIAFLRRDTARRRARPKKSAPAAATPLKSYT